MLSVAGIGLGDLGRMECRTLAGLDGVELVGGVDPAQGSRDTFEDETGVPAYESLSDLYSAHEVDAVSIASPHTVHYDQARFCLERDTHVHLEKPMVTDLDHADDLIERAAARDLVLAVGYQRHFDPRFREMRRLIREGRIGTPHMAACHLEQVWIEWTHKTWRGDPALSGGGQLYDSGSHLLDALLWCTDADPTSVAATLDEQEYDVDVNTALAATLDRDGDRITASIGVSGDGQSVPAPGESLRIYGTEGAIEYDGETISVTEDGTTYTAEPSVPGFDELTRRKLRNFVGAITDDADLDIPAGAARKVTALTEAAYEAAESGRTVRIDD